MMILPYHPHLDPELATASTPMDPELATASTPMDRQSRGIRAILMKMERTGPHCDEAS